MSLHDAYARVTPFELTFEDPARADSLVVEVDEEAARGGLDARNPHAFMTMRSVGAFVRELEEPDAPAEVLHRYIALAYHAVAFAREGRPFYLLGTHAARYLVEGAPGGEPSPPSSAGYLQLPQHMFWFPGSGEGPPESIDGVSWTVTGGVLHSMLVYGLRPDRPGVGVVPLPEAPLADAPEWAVDSVSEGESSWSSALPGAELDGLYEVRTAGHVLRLLSRFFSYAGRFPHLFVEGPDAPAGADLPRPSRLSYTKVTLDG